MFRGSVLGGLWGYVGMCSDCFGRCLEVNNKITLRTTTTSRPIKSYGQDAFFGWRIASSSCTGDGRSFASNFWIHFWSRISRIWAIVCIYGGYQDLLGFYHGLPFLTLGLTGSREEHLPETPNRMTYKII